MDWKEKQKTKIIQKMDNYITGIQDICGDVRPSGLFYFFADRCSYLLTKSPEDLITKGSIRFHKVVNPIIRNLCLLFMGYKQTITVANLNALPKEPVIWCVNHGFKDDYMTMHTGYQKYYDKEIELCADYRPKDIVRPEEVWASIACIRNVHAGNILHIQYVKALILQEQRRAFQRRFF